MVRACDGKCELGLIAEDPKAIGRVTPIAEEFDFCFQHWKTLEEFMQSSPAPQCRVIVAIAAGAGKERAAEFAQVCRMISPSSHVVCVVDERLGREIAEFVKKSGANIVLLAEELYETSKLEFACTQVIRASHLPVKTGDLVAGSQLSFDLFHLLPQRQKFLKFMFEGDVLDAERLKKVSQVGELYIGRDAAERFNTYMQKHQDMSAAGLAKRCRTQLMALNVSYCDLVFHLTDQSEHASFKRGEEMLKKCRDLSDGLLSSLGAYGNAWEIVNNSSIGGFGAVERAPAIAAYAGLFGLQLELEELNDIMLAALLGDLGLLLLPPSVVRKAREDKLQELKEEEQALYRKYPLKSLDILLNRKLSLNESPRKLLVSSNERADGKGFPHGMSGAKVGDGVQLIQFCRAFDRRTVLKLGQARPNPEEVRKAIIREELGNPSRFTPTFLERLRRVFPL